jgi:hypothetical protein
MPVNFTDSPSNGDTITSGGFTYTYNSTTTRWKSSGGSDLNTEGVQDVVGAMFSAGVGITATYEDSDGTVDLVVPEAAGLSVYATFALLIAVTGMSTGDLAYVTATNKLYLYSVNGWFLVATVSNASPSAITGVSATYTLATDATATVITAVSTDPEGFPLTWSYAVTTGSLTNGGGATATVSQSDNVFTVTPTTTQAYAGAFTITFSATDGLNGAVNAVGAFTLAFHPRGRQAYYKAGSISGPAYQSTYTFTVPTDVTSICVLCIGAGGDYGGSGAAGGAGGGLRWKNDIPVSAGATYKAVIGTAGGDGGNDSGDATRTAFQTSGGTNILYANGGESPGGNSITAAGGTGWSSSSSTYGTGTSGGGTGGAGGPLANGKYGGGGGAAGYAGNGGRGGYGTGSYENGLAGSGGGGGGSSSGSASTGGGGVGRYGQGSNGAGGTNNGSGWGGTGKGGSGGSDGAGAGNSAGGDYGGGAGYNANPGGDATIQIIWGTGRAYPSTQTGLSDDS